MDKGKQRWPGGAAEDISAGARRRMTEYIMSKGESWR